MNSEGLRKILKKNMKWFKTDDYSGMEEDLQKEMKDLVNDDDTIPSKNIRLVIATNISLIAKAYDDEPLARLQIQALLADNKKEIREILSKIKEILEDPKFKE